MKFSWSVFCYFSLFLYASTAKAETLKNGRSYTPSLAAPQGDTMALSGGGTANVSDLSAASSNPAGLALFKEFASAGAMLWKNDNVLAVQAGAHDSAMSEVSAGFIYQMTTVASGGKDKRYTLGLAEKVADSALTLGIGGDYSQLEAPKTPGFSDKKVDVFRLRAGAIYAIAENIAVGVRTEGYLDSMRDKEHAAGIAIGIAQYYLFNADVVFRNTELKRYLAGMTLSVKQFLDLRASYGYELKASHHLGAAGISIKSQQFRLFYMLAKPDLRDISFDQSVGASLAVAL